MNRDHERRGQRGEEQVGAAVMPPLVAAAGPAQREPAVELRARVIGAVLQFGAIARRRQVRNQAHEPEDRADGKVRADRDDVPHQRAHEVRPELAFGGIGNDVVEHPEAPEVDQRKQTGGHDGEDRHRLGRARDSRPPAGTDEMEDRGDERAGVRDTDPENEVDDVDAPAHRDAEAGDAHARFDLVHPARERPAEPGDKQGHDGVVPPARRLRGPEHVVADLTVSQFRFYNFFTGGIHDSSRSLASIRRR